MQTHPDRVHMGKPEEMKIYKNPTRERKDREQFKSTREEESTCRYYLMMSGVKSKIILNI